MKKLIIFLAFIGLSGSVFAQVSCDGIVPADEECVCDFVKDTMAMENDTGVNYDHTTTYKGKGDLIIDVHFQCPDAASQQVSIVFRGGKDKTCRVNWGGNQCVILIPHTTYQDYKGKKLNEAKRALRDYMDAAGY